MSSNREDQSNVYQIFSKSNKNNPTVGDIKSATRSLGIQSGQVIKSGALSASTQPSVQVHQYLPAAVTGEPVLRSSILPPALRSHLALSSLKQNFKELNDLQARLRFMLQDLEEIVKE